MNVFCYGVKKPFLTSFQTLKRCPKNCFTFPILHLNDCLENEDIFRAQKHQNWLKNTQNVWGTVHIFWPGIKWQFSQNVPTIFIFDREPRSNRGLNNCYVFVVVLVLVNQWVLKIVGKAKMI